MTGTNHVLTGVAIALVIPQPELAVSLAFLSHFVLDAMPHFGLNRADVFERNKKLSFKIALPIDIALVTAVFFWMVFIERASTPSWLIVLCAVAALAPDVVWIYRFFRDIKERHEWSGNWLTRLHRKIQWGERPWGIIIEFVWLAGVIVVLV